MNRATRLSFLVRARIPSDVALVFGSDGAALENQEERVRRSVECIGHWHDLLSAPEAATQATAAALGSNPSVCEAVRDLDYGRWRGATFESVLKADPSGLAEWLKDPNAAPHGGESLTMAARRVTQWMAGAMDLGGHRLVVTHGMIGKLAMASVLEAPLTAVSRIDLPFLAVLTFRSDGRRWNLLVDER